MVTKINSIIIALIIGLKIRGSKVKNRVVYKLQENSGNWFEEALKYIVGIVIGILFLGGLYLLFKDTVLVKIGEAVNNFFNFTG